MLKKINLKKVKKRNKMYILEESTPFMIKEAYNTARTNLISAVAISDKNSIVFTSCCPDEGKTTTCLNMAISLSNTGKNVLIIEADLRNPKLNKYLKINNKQGLSSLLRGTCEFKDVLKSNVRENLDVVTAGDIPKNPTELLSSPIMGKLLSILNEHYDYILIDTPPVNVVTDSQLMNEHIAGNIMIVKENYTTHTELEKALKSIEMARGKVIGLIKVYCNLPQKSKYYTYN